MPPHRRREFLETLGAFVVLPAPQARAERTMAGGSRVFEA